MNRQTKIWPIKAQTPDRPDRSAKNRLLLDLRFFELHMLAHDGIVFVEFQFLGLRTGVFLGDIEIACISSGNELDLNNV